jgi:hypothetical protein
MCLASTSLLASGCYSTSDIDGGSVEQFMACYPYMPADQQEVFGILPGASNLEATYSNGVQQAVQLSNSVFVLDATPTTAPYPTQLSWQDASGQHSEPTGMTPNPPMPHPCTAATVTPNGESPSQAIANAKALIAAGEM